MPTPTTVQGELNKKSATGHHHIVTDIDNLASYLTSFVAAMLPAPEVQADYNETNSAAMSFIKNKPAARSWNNSPGRSIVSVAAAANGFQISTTQDALMVYSVTITSTSTIASGQRGDAVLEICATNSATAGDWSEVCRVTNGQILGLAIALSISQPICFPLVGTLPKAWYARIRSIPTTGTPAFAIASQQEMKL